jgi:protein-tyrosine phosphatase
MRNGFPNESPPARKDNVVYYNPRWLKSIRNEMKYSSEVNVRDIRRLRSQQLICGRWVFSLKENSMIRGSHPLSTLLLGAALASSLAGIGCAEHHAYRVYDPYYTDYHTWNDHEVVYYRQWADETHHDHDRDFRKLRPEEQK